MPLPPDPEPRFPSRFLSRKLIVVVLLLLTLNVQFALGHVSEDTFRELIKWLGAAYLGGQSIVDAFGRRAR